MYILRNWRATPNPKFLIKNGYENDLIRPPIVWYKWIPSPKTNSLSVSDKSIGLMQSQTENTSARIWNMEITSTRNVQEIKYNLLQIQTTTNNCMYHFPIFSSSHLLWCCLDFWNRRENYELQILQYLYWGPLIM